MILVSTGSACPACITSFSASATTASDSARLPSAARLDDAIASTPYAEIAIASIKPGFNRNFPPSRKIMLAPAVHATLDNWARPNSQKFTQQKISALFPSSRHTRSTTQMPPGGFNLEKFTHYPRLVVLYSHDSIRTAQLDCGDGNLLLTDSRKI